MSRTPAGPVPARMRAWQAVRPGPMAGAARAPGLDLVELPVPTPGRGEILVQVAACGVCRTDLHVVEGDLVVHRPRVVPGHEVVGHVAALGATAERFAVGDRVGLAWLRSTCGACRFCRRGAENLCAGSAYTGWDADGGYAEYAVARQEYAYRLPEQFADTEAAPLLCAGIIGYRALRRARLPPGGRLGIYGFGASAHLAAQVALAQGAVVHVMTRSAQARRLARDLGAASAQDTYDPPPEPLDAALDFTPVGQSVPAGLVALDRGGTLVVAGIHLSDIPPLRYAEHLFGEKDLRSVTSTTRADGEEFLLLAARLRVRVTTTAYPFDAADRALADLAADRVAGAAVLVMGGQTSCP